jgi:outer membrane protein insertion porin family
LINEGGRTGVKTISFVGNQAFSSTRLRRVIATRESSWLSWLNRKDVYDPAKIEADEELLRRFYMSNGYADFRVLSVDSTFDEEKGKYHVVFTLEEGTQYRFGDITIDSSIPDIDADSLYRYVKMKKGRVFNATLVERTIEDMTVELTGRGYPFVEVQPRGDRDYTNATINITLLVDEGARIYVERIEIYGNTKTRDYVIRREFDFAEGDAYNRVLVDRAERRLRNTGFFKTVTITTQRGSLPDQVILVVTDLSAKSL